MNIGRKGKIKVWCRSSLGQFDYIDLLVTVAEEKDDGFYKVKIDYGQPFSGFFLLRHLEEIRWIGNTCPMLARMQSWE